MLIELTVLNAPAAASFVDQDLARGSLMSIESAPAFTSFSAPCSITSGSLPYGLSLNTTTGEISGTPVMCAPRASVTITDNNAEGQTISLGVAPKTTMPSPRVSFVNLDYTAAVALWGLTTDDTDTTFANLESASVTALDDGGTADTPKLHKLTYSGADDETRILRLGNGGTPDANSYLWVDMGGAKVGQIYVYPNCNVIVENVVSVGNTTDPLENAGASQSYAVVGSKIGRWFRAAPDRQQVLEEQIVGDVWLEGCHIAGAGNAMRIRDGNLALVDSLVTHVSIDTVGGFNASTGRTNYIMGSVFSHYVLAFEDVVHPDWFQSGGSAGANEYLDAYENIIIMDTMRYGGTVVRVESGGAINIDMQRNVVSAGGPNIFAGNDAVWNLKEITNIPVPDGGSVGASFQSTITSYTFEDFVGLNAGALTVSGTEETYALTAAGIEAQFPSVTGADDSLAARYNQGAGTMYIPDQPEVTFSPQSMRDYISTTWEPATTWSTLGFQDPATYGGTYAWPTAAAWSSIALSGASASGTTLTVTAPSVGGVLYACVSSDSATPRHASVRDGVNADGDYDGSPTSNASDSTRPYRVTASGSQNYTLPITSASKWVHMFYEDEDGVTTPVITTP